jgi:hypothetical protein
MHLTVRLTLHYVENAAAVVQRGHQFLVPGSRLVVTVLHPVITSHEAAPSEGRLRTDWTVDQYFQAGPRRRRWLGDTVTWYHRTIEQYVTSFSTAGFTLTALRTAVQRFVLSHDR